MVRSTFGPILQIKKVKTRPVSIPYIYGSLVNAINLLLNFRVSDMGKGDDSHDGYYHIGSKDSRVRGVE